MRACAKLRSCDWRAFSGLTLSLLKAYHVTLWLCSDWQPNIGFVCVCVSDVNQFGSLLFCTF